MTPISFARWAMMKLLLPDLLRLVLLAEDLTQVGVDVEALVVAWHASNN